VTGARGFEKTVAIKTMLPTLSDDPNFERMFLDEARIASRIRHPNVAEILDLGEQDNLLYLVMEWIDGAPLSLIMRESFRRGGMPVNIGVRIIQDVCAGLHAAHELKGDDGKSLELVHRDVSPQNIMLTENGVVKLVDFGVAKALGRSAGETDTGLIRGKLAYLSPEQVVAQPLDRRADVFAVGVILYQITTGKHPFRADNAGATMNNILRRTVPKPSKVVGPSYPAKLDEIVMRALDREQEFRFQTAADVLKALDEVFIGRDRATTEDVAAFIQPIIGPSGEEFRHALRQASRPNSSSEDMASLLASGAHPVEGTPASGEWIMRSSSMAEAARRPSFRPAPLEETPAPPRPPAFSAPDSSGGAAGAHPPASQPSLSESTMAGAERDTQPPVRPSARRRNIGVAILGVVLVSAIGVVLVARFIAPGNQAAAPAPMALASAASPATSATLPARTDDAADATVAQEGGASAAAAKDASTDAPVDDAGGDGGGDAGPAAAKDEPARHSTPSSGGTYKPKGPPPRTTSTGKKWTPPVSDPGF
ncbi:MAG: serine/threonine protein kinase, partial [Myxococcota bacterium]